MDVLARTGSQIGQSTQALGISGISGMQAKTGSLMRTSTQAGSRKLASVKVQVSTRIFS